MADPKHPSSSASPLQSTPRIKLTLKKRSQKEQDATTATPRLKLVVNPPRQSTPESTTDLTTDLTTDSNSTNANEPFHATPSTRRIKFIVKKPESTLDPILSAVPSDPVDNEDSSSTTEPANQSNVDCDQLKDTAEPSVESSFVPVFNMDLPNPPFNTSRASASDYDETSASIHPTSEISATSASPKTPNTRSSSKEGPFGYSGYRSPLRDFVFITPPDPSTNITIDPALDPSMDPNMDPHQLSDPYAMAGITPFEDPNVLPSSFMYPDQSLHNNDLPIDPLGIYTPEEYGRIMASERDLLRAMGAMSDPIAEDYLNDPHAIRHYPHLLAREEHRQTDRFHGDDGLVAEFDAIIAAMKATNAEIPEMQPEYWRSIGPAQPYPRESDAPESSLPQNPAAQLESNEQAHAQIPYAQDAPKPSHILQSVEEAYTGPAMKRARYSAANPRAPTPEASTTVSASTSVSAQRRSNSSRVKTTAPSSTSTYTLRRSKRQATPEPAPSRHRSGTSSKTEAATPEPTESATTVSPRRLRSSDVNTTTTNKVGKGNVTPESWETAPIADKMMSQMKQTTKMSWSDITEAWNENRPATNEKMTMRALSKRWGRIKNKIGVWPGFDEVLLENLRAFDSKLDEEGFLQISQDVSAELGWEIPGSICQGRYKVLQEDGKVNLKGKGRARK
ncbi:hypothetical protein N7491_001182 [Penicillium cf. griseofulvum]|uniref:Uncharacterized protein n=1 Tax=Penicillium cf. griseofulvum TaxID=2972120 RepID=A0A9W9MB66_9EURO|nr:hypothetical protein N7472_006318 [Penicillium cf. griseofulvum]KAJ5445100.1 hypothetical protein N7491_001182 [Penicillium cf. griseofulvum]